ncbi:MAG: hypothetical protein Q8J64_03610 [Thermodesulfovibrionales bacterium]|nr:hypothetical protein [Thermodesulfovibrionales bacterium]
MSRKTTVFLFILLLLPVIVYLIRPTDEGRIKKLIKEGAEAVEKEDIAGVMSKISFTYQDKHGLSYILLRQLFEQEFKTLSGIKVEYENLGIAVDGEKAGARIDVRVIATSGGQTGYYIGDIREPAHLVLELEKGPVGRWLVANSAGLEIY